jgi:hypothetical protein
LLCPRGPLRFHRRPAIGWAEGRPLSLAPWSVVAYFDAAGLRRVPLRSSSCECAAPPEVEQVEGRVKRPPASSTRELPVAAKGRVVAEAEAVVVVVLRGPASSASDPVSGAAAVSDPGLGRWWSRPCSDSPSSPRSSPAAGRSGRPGQPRTRTRACRGPRWQASPARSGERMAGRRRLRVSSDAGVPLRPSRAEGKKD